VDDDAMTADTRALILIVDDDYDFLEINRLLLERAGYRVTTAADAPQALAKMDREAPALVITDLMMASLDSGFSFAESLETDARFSAIPVIMSTSVSSALGMDFRPQSDQDLAQMHVDAYFDKPLDPTLLLAKIAELLETDQGGDGADSGELGSSQTSEAH
jgi:CheY-like chemotaxis protein